jgi:hypothetical protein
MTGEFPIRAFTESSIMLDRIISGGQSGADQAAWRAAQVFDIPTGGWMARGFPTEDGPHPWFAECYGAVEMPLDSDLTGTERNVQDSDATLWFGETTTAAAQATVGACHRFGKPCMPVYPSATFQPGHVATWITENQVRTLNVAGNSEREEVGIGEQVESFLGQVLRLLGHSMSHE